MRSLPLLFLSLFLVGCNQNLQSDPRTLHGIDSAFSMYVAQFEYYLGRSIGDIPIQFVPQHGNVVGECIVWNSQWREIQIDPNYWNADPNDGGPIDDDEKLSLVWHELSHCVLNRGHLATTFDDNGWLVFTSLMNPYLFFSHEYPETKAYYINELFHPAPGYPTLGGSSGESDDFVHINTEAKYGI